MVQGCEFWLLAQTHCHQSRQNERTNHNTEKHTCKKFMFFRAEILRWVMVDCRRPRTAMSNPFALPRSWSPRFKTFPIERTMPSAILSGLLFSTCRTAFSWRETTAPCVCHAAMQDHANITDERRQIALSSNGKTVTAYLQLIFECVSHNNSFDPLVHILRGTRKRRRLERWTAVTIQVVEQTKHTGIAWTISYRKSSTGCLCEGQRRHKICRSQRE